jgi:ubiquinone/menaquinone biosynthesis C-methylase UbiE
VANYLSSNYQKYQNPNPIQRWMISRFYSAIRQMITKTDGKSLLDAGCGEGLSIKNIKKERQFSRIYGIDLSLPAIKLANKINTQSMFIQGSVLNLPFKDESFGVVICLEVLEHLEKPEQGLREILRVTSRYILLSVPNEPYFQIANFLRGKNLTRLGDDIGHIQHWSAHNFISFMSQHTQVLFWRTSFPWTIALCQKRL